MIMSLHHLSQYQSFDFERFAQGKVFLCTGCSPWIEHNTKRKLGTRVEVVIIKDNTQYNTAPDDTTNNLFEKLVFKVAKELNVPSQVHVIPIGATATVYGEYRNMLSIKCEDIRLANNQQPQNAKN